MEPIKLQVVSGTGTPEVEVLDAGALFEQGGLLLSQKKYREALTTYDKLLTHFPDSRFVSPTLYNKGLAAEWLRDFSQAAGSYLELLRRFGATKEAIDAGFRLGGCYQELGNWAASAQTFADILTHKKLSASDRIEALARRGLALFRLGDERGSRSTFLEAIGYYRSIEAMERLDTDFFLAMAHYYLAALPHLEFRKLKVDAKEKLAQTLDEKARLLLDSQAKYIQTIKVKNPYWATAAGFQIGSLYREFYRILLTTIPDFKKKAKENARLAGIKPEKAEEQLIQVYVEQVHVAVKPLLTKAIRVFENTVLVAERIGVRSEWVGKSVHQLNLLKHLLSLPPSEAVKVVSESHLLPEDEPADEIPGLKENDGKQQPGKTPGPSPDSPQQKLEEPGRVIL